MSVETIGWIIAAFLACWLIAAYLAYRDLKIRNDELEQQRGFGEREDKT